MESTVAALGSMLQLEKKGKKANFPSNKDLEEIPS